MLFTNELLISMKQYSAEITKKKILIILLGVAIIMAIDGYASAHTYYVDKNGNNNNAGSETFPWLTIQKAAVMAKSGDVVYIKNGIYVEKVAIQNSGTSGNMITFKAYPGHAVIIDGTGNAGWHGVVSLHGKRYVKLENLEIRNNRIGWGVLIEHEKGNNQKASANIELSGLNVHHTGGEPIQVRGNAHNIVIKSCSVHDAAKPSGIDIYQWDGGRPRHVTVTGCTAYNFPKFAGIASEQADDLIIEKNVIYASELGLDIGSGDRNILRKNTIYDCKNGIALSSNEDTEIYGNVIRDIYDEAIYNYYWSAHGEAHARNKWHGNMISNAGFGIYESNQKSTAGGVGPTSDHQYFNNLFHNVGTHGSYRAPFYFKGVTGIKFYNNTVYMNNGYGAIELLENAAGADIRNNIFSVSGRVDSIKMDGSSLPGSIIDYNCYHNRSGSATGPGNHSIFSDPRFSNPINNDFRLLNGSPCIDAGASSGTIPSEDILGKKRCDVPQTVNSGGGPRTYFDMGAYEHPCGNTVPAAAH
jgi:parallel beta-helix repeat protein